MVPDLAGWTPIARGQDDVIARPQLLAAGLTRSQVSRYLANRRWQVLFPGVYLTHTGPVSRRSVAWAGLLYAGAGAALSHGTALWWDGIVDEPPGAIDLTIPSARRVAPQPGLRVHRSSAIAARTHPSRVPVRTRIEESVLDHLESAEAQGVIDVLTRATQRRLTTAPRLRAALAQRARHPQRSLIAQILADVDVGAASPLEHRYLRDVERPHALPPATRNQADRTGAGNRYHDVRYRTWAVVVELDGRAAHPITEAFRDLRRDNSLVLAGETVLRFGWVDVATRPCAVAGQVGQVLRRGGWAGRPRPCGPRCGIADAA